MTFATKLWDSSLREAAPIFILTSLVWRYLIAYNFLYTGCYHETKLLIWYVKKIISLFSSLAINEPEDIFICMFAIHLFYELTVHMPCECPLQSKDINPLHVSTLQRMSFHDLHFIDA